MSPFSRSVPLFAFKPATAYELSQLDHPAEQVAMAKKVVAEKLMRDQAAAAVRERTGRGDFPGKVRAEIRLDDGRKVTLSGLPDERSETILAVLRQATKQVQGRLREASRSEEEAA